MIARRLLRWTAFDSPGRLSHLALSALALAWAAVAQAQPVGYAVQSDGDDQLEGHVFHKGLGRYGYSFRGRISGNRITSRIDGLFVSSITRRSIPTPSPAAGGIPYSSARM